MDRGTGAEHRDKLREQLGDGWAELLIKELEKEYLLEIGQIVAQERQKYTIYPAKDDVFRAFRLTPFKDVRVVIVGQDPYHNGTADGLAFSSRNAHPQRSLGVIFKAIAYDGFEPKDNADLSRWAKQGVFLLNTSLTVRKGQAGSHSNIGWQRFTAVCIAALSRSPTPTVFMLWGNHAKQFKKYIHPDNHLILESAHPAAELYSGYTAGFVDAGHFQECNDFLQMSGFDPIDWR